ncbi:MAG: hypothetical protein IBJ16_08340, partial [Chitinophagaceae bacterium]|nr:hypothetical protein [Chitinophagaceae bacterium]
MKYILQTISLIMIGGTLMLTACTKRPVTPQLPPVPPQQPSGKLSKLVYDTGAYDSLYYLADGRLSKLVNNIDPAVSGGVRYELKYHSSGKLERINSSEGWYYLYLYSNGKLASIS